ncbi:hypothetical protein EJM73_08185 [Clostridium botulinum]|uniref:hypothetical protein n=1 Tax=Clostridium botulinum TaxID=1491 RepID=UPI00137629FD|nr:hypothetical protein [Clostridium botulinum]NCI19878.1 hypothetical protein [Clostridium botulinum]NCI35640.1 hypothetical protein [Clostridium botulinum]NCI71773.1 hypothetical protein [Clostridium botulinum]NDI38689.1 hypothetical protein [Clostridium botulinum]HCL4455030.1 hypothetical protein [Clostridium botulinum]
MELDKIIKFNDKIIIEDKMVMGIYGDFNITTGHCSLFCNPLDTTTIKNNKEEVQKQIEKFTTKLRENMMSEGFLYTI